MITQRSTYQAENWTSNTKKPHQVIPQSYFRYEPISPSYDPNEFVKNYNKKSHQKFRQLRPAKKKAVSMNFWILSSRLARARRDLADIDDKNQKFKEILSKKCVSKSQNPTINASFQGLELLSQVLNKLDRN